MKRRTNKKKLKQLRNEGVDKDKEVGWRRPQQAGWGEEGSRKLIEDYYISHIYFKSNTTLDYIVFTGWRVLVGNNQILFLKKANAYILEKQYFCPYLFKTTNTSRGYC